MRPPAAGRAASRSWLPRTSGAASPRSSRGNRRRRHEHHQQSRRRPARLRADRARRADDRRRAARDRERHRLRPVGRNSSSTPTGSAHRTVLDVGKVLGVPDGGNPHQWYSQASVEKVISRLAADLASSTPRTDPTTNATRGRTRRSVSAQYVGADRADQAHVRGNADRRVREHRRAAGRSARARR